MVKAGSGPSGLAPTLCALGVVSHTGVAPSRSGRVVLAETCRIFKMLIFTKILVFSLPPLHCTVVALACPWVLTDF